MVIMVENNNAKRVEQKLQSVVDAISSEVWEGFKTFFRTGCFYFAGGCLYSIWNDKEPKDYDIFCTSRAALKLLKTHFELYASSSLQVHTSKNAISVQKYQFVIRHIGMPEDEVAKFDFMHNCYWYDNTGIHASYGWDYINSNKLVFNSTRARDVLNIATRVPKFIARGMEISQEEMLKILECGTRVSKYVRERRSIKGRLSGKDQY